LMVSTLVDFTSPALRDRSIDAHFEHELRIASRMVRALLQFGQVVCMGCPPWTMKRLNLYPFVVVRAVD
jgi:hypothetical protein